ncbi:MAG: hypothetical protein LBU86_05975 [Oscillospiraceae bacterium]|jgi:hypothetical protein|nr:hypothetical protein [Oscillospiraceae bacterium]
MGRIDDMRAAIAQFGESNRVVEDAAGKGSYYVAIPQTAVAGLLKDGDEAIHPAFIVKGAAKKEILIGKYHACVEDGRAYSLPGNIPGMNLNFDEAAALCANKGEGHHLITNAEYAMLALLARKNGTQPRGNTNWGASFDMSVETGTPATKEWEGELRTMTVMTGSGFPAWYHNGNLSGIEGLCGNLWNWCGGLRLLNGEINIIPDNDAAAPHADMSPLSDAWRAIMPNGSLVAPGSPGTLKWDYTAAPEENTAGIELATALSRPQPDDGPFGFKPFSSLTAGAGVGLPMIIKALGLFPDGEGKDHSGTFWCRNSGERLPIRGGSFHNDAAAGIFTLNMRVTRSLSNHTCGFRAAYYG